jgi:hypothetical protein
MNNARMSRPLGEKVSEASEKEAASVHNPSRDSPAESDGQQLLV